MKPESFMDVTALLRLATDPAANGVDKDAHIHTLENVQAALRRVWRDEITAARGEAEKKALEEARWIMNMAMDMTKRDAKRKLAA